MAVNQSLGSIAEIEGWQAIRERGTFSKIFTGLTSFARRKPLGFACGLIVLFMAVVGDLVPVTGDIIYSFGRTALAQNIKVPVAGVHIGPHLKFGHKISIQSAKCSPLPCLAPHIA